jgi:hypothetical protein
MKYRGKTRLCLFCQIPFIPCKNNVHYQQFCCNTDECKKASNRASSKKYRERKRSDKKWKEKECERVKKYQKEHPDYWKREKKANFISGDLLLRDFAQAQKVTTFPVLRDIVMYLSACLAGYVAHTTDWEEGLLLRDFIATRLNPLYDKGIALSSEGNIKSFKEEDYHDPKGNRKSGACQTHAGRVRVGGSPPG